MAEARSVRPPPLLFPARVILYWTAERIGDAGRVAGKASMTCAIMGSNACRGPKLKSKCSIVGVSLKGRDQPDWSEQKKAGLEARRSRGPTNVKTFQRERPTRQRREEESGAACSQPRVISAASRLFATRRASCKGCAQNMAWRYVSDASFRHIAEQRFGLMGAA